MRKSWNTIVKDPDTKEIVVNELNTVYNIGTSFIYESEDLLGTAIGPISPELDKEADASKLFIPDSSMSKGEFRDLINKSILGIAPGSTIDPEKVEQVLRTILKVMRKAHGGLNYNQHYASLAAQKYFQKNVPEN